jgi:membrane-associated PAP2 superfamily phosphatase
MTTAKQIIWSCGILVLVLIFFEYSHFDIYLQNYFYKFTEKSWLITLDKDSIMHLIFYDGIKRALILFELILLIFLLFFRKKTYIKKNISGLIIVFLSLIIVPLSIGTIKKYSNVTCPASLIQYGGDIHHIKIFERYPEGLKPEKPQKCFPAAHASGGFALLALFFLAKTNKGRAIAIIFALSIGWLMGGYKMLIGHHFLSHTVVSMVLSWLIINLIALLMKLKIFKFDKSNNHNKCDKQKITKGDHSI